MKYIALTHLMREISFLKCRAARGTKIVCHLKDDALEFCDKNRVESVIYWNPAVILANDLTVELHACLPICYAKKVTFRCEIF